jgi:hypothetical protein
MTGVYTLLARLVVLALVLLFVASSTHSARSRLLVAGAYTLTLALAWLLPYHSLAWLLLQLALGITLLIVGRWEHAPDEHF